MWIFKLISCLMHGHAFADMSLAKTPYKYCLRCGHVESPESVRVHVKAT